MLDMPGLQAALLQIQQLVYNRNVFRCVELAALLGDGTRPIRPLYDVGPRQSGQRYTPIGAQLASYVAEHPYTSYVEATGMFSCVAALAQQHAPAEVTLQLNVNLQSVLDLTLADNQQLLQTTTIELTRSWEWQMAMGQACAYTNTW